MKRFIVVGALVVLAAFMYAWAGEYKNGIYELTHVTDTTVDTAHVILVTTFTARDSFAYIDSIYDAIAADNWTTGDTVVSVTTPPQIMVLTPTFDQTTTYSCSVDLGTNIRGYEKDYTGGVATLAALIDTLVAGINGVSTMSDTIIAEDSVTYILIRSKVAQDGLEGDARWKMKCVATGTGTLDTASHVSLSTITSISTLMVAEINGADSIGTYFLASVSGDSGYYVQNRDAGVAGFSLGIADTAQDTVQVTAPNVGGANDGKSTSTDTIYLFPTLANDYKTISGTIVVGASAVTTGGYGGGADGAGDSVWAKVYAIGGGRTWLLLAGSDSVGEATDLPLTVYVGRQAAMSDTLWREGLAAIVTIKDTASSSTAAAATFNHAVSWDFIVR